MSNTHGGTAATIVCDDGLRDGWESLDRPRHRPFGKMEQADPVGVSALDSREAMAVGWSAGRSYDTWGGFAGRRPYWQRQACPSWCVFEPHGLVHPRECDVDDRVHRSVVVEVVLTVEDPQTEPAGAPQVALVYLEQHDAESEPRVLLCKGKTTRLVMLTLDEAAGLVGELTTLAGIGRGDHESAATGDGEGDLMPVWQTEPCPPWCGVKHDARDMYEDRIHDGENRELVVALENAWRDRADESQPEVLRLLLEQHYRAAAPYAVLMKGDGGGDDSIRMTLDETVELAEALRKLARSGVPWTEASAASDRNHRMSSLDDEIAAGIDAETVALCRRLSDRIHAADAIIAAAAEQAAETGVEPGRETSIELGRQLGRDNWSPMLEKHPNTTDHRAAMNALWLVVGREAGRRGLTDSEITDLVQGVTEGLRERE